MPYKYYYIPGPFSIVQRACAHRVQESTYAVYIYIVSYMVNIFIYIYSHLMAYQKMSDARWRAITKPCTMHRSIYSILYLFRIYDMRLINFIATRWLWHCLAVCWHHVTLPSVLNARCSCFFFFAFWCSFPPSASNAWAYLWIIYTRISYTSSNMAQYQHQHHSLPIDDRFLMFIACAVQAKLLLNTINSINAWCFVPSVSYTTIHDNECILVHVIIITLIYIRVYVLNDEHA